eukprot:GGOE01053641.1.p1 GENE.GGOE01053641.1~~GGOE01053641.1.p1  ORF type:complete len:1176 (-),score=438.55 GGOE01053641.1:128-3655(-)
MRERYRNLQPTLEHFLELDDNAAEVRRHGAQKLLQHIQAVATNENDEVDEEHDVTEYCAKRLLRGCCKREGGTRIGSALALCVLLKECPTLQPAWLLALARKILVSPKHSADKDVAWAKAFLYMALILSGRVYDRENCGRVVAALLDLRKFKHVRQLLAQLLGQCISQCTPAVVVGQLWGRLKDALADPTGYTPELLYLALKFQAAFQSPAKQKDLPDALLRLLKTNFWEKVLLVEMRSSLVIHLFDQHPQVHIVWPAIVTSVFTSSEDPACVATHFKTMFQLLIEDTLRETQDQFRVIHAETEISVSIIAAIETLSDEAVRNDLLYFLYNAKPKLVVRGLMRLVRSRVTPSQPVDGLIRQFWHVVELGPEDDENATGRRSYEEEVEELMALPGDSDGEEEEEGSSKGRGARVHPSKPVVRSFSGFRTIVQQYLLMALKLHAHEDAECLEQVIEFCMNNALFCVPSTVDRREVLRRGDMKRVITAGLFNLLGSLLQSYTGQNPRFMHTAMELLVEKEVAYEARYDALAEGSTLAEARDAILQLSKRLQGLLPEKWDKAGVFTAHQALSRMLGFAFFYLTVIQDEGIPDLLLDLCQYGEANLQDLTTDMDTQIDLTLALLTYQVDFKAKCHDAAHTFKLLQQATLSLFRKTCAHLTQTGLSRIVDAFRDPMKVVEIGDAAEGDDDDDEEVEDAPEGEAVAEQEQPKKVAKAKEEPSDDESDVDLMDADMAMDIDETQMAMVLKAHQAVADRRKAEQDRLLREEAIVKNIRLKMLDLAAIYIEKCDCSGAVLTIAPPVLGLMVEEMKRIHGSKKSRIKREKRRLGPKDTQLYTKMRSLLRDVVKSKPKPEEGALDAYVDACVATLEQCAKVVKSHDLGLEGSVMKGDLLVCAVWAAGNLLRGMEAGAKECDEDRIRNHFVVMFASKQISMRTESTLKELLQRFLQRFGVVYIKFIIPALCEAVNRKAQDGGDGHPYTKLVVLKCLDTTVQYVLPKSAAHGAEHLTLLGHLRTMLQSAQSMELNAAGIELLLDLTWHCLKWDRKRAVQPAAAAIWKAYKDRTDHNPRSRLNVKLIRGVLQRAGSERQEGTDNVHGKRKSRDPDQQVAPGSEGDAKGPERKKRRTSHQNGSVKETEPMKRHRKEAKPKKSKKKLGLYLEGRRRNKKKAKQVSDQPAAAK